MSDRDSMSFDWDDIVATYNSQPWWVWVVGCLVAWFGLKWFISALRAYRERPILSEEAFWQSGVRVDYGVGTITLPVATAFRCSGFAGFAGRTTSGSGAITPSSISTI